MPQVPTSAQARVIESLRVLGAATATQLRFHAKMSNDTVHRACRALLASGDIVCGHRTGGGLPYRLARPDAARDEAEVRPTRDVEEMKRRADPLCKRGCGGDGYTQPKEYGFERRPCACTRDANAGHRPPARMAVRHMSARINPMEAA